MKSFNLYIFEKLRIDKEIKIETKLDLIKGGHAIALGIDPEDGEIQITKLFIREVSDTSISISRYEPLELDRLSNKIVTINNKNDKGYFYDDLWGKKTVILPVDEGLNVIDFIINNSKKFNDLYDIYNFPIDEWMDYKIKDDIGFILKGIYDNMLKIKTDLKNG